MKTTSTKSQPQDTLSPRTSRIYIRILESKDRKEVMAANQASVSFHTPWISAPLTSHAFRAYYQRTRREDHEGIVCCLKQTDEIIGVFNINSIERGTFQSATLGYYCHAGFTGQGLMTEGLHLVLQYAFKELGLHRVEANIQPDNEASRKLVQRCGFVLEGFSPKFLFINGKWRDHERWAAMDDRLTLHSNPVY